MSRRSVVIIGVAAFLLLLPAFAVSAVSIQSTAVAGDQVTGPNGSITRIKGSWVVPILDCATTPNANSTISVMLDGMGSNTNERMQIGTSGACVSGQAVYKVFQVLEPYSRKVVVPSITIRGGDTVEAQGKWSPQTHGWHDQIIDVTTGLRDVGYAKAPSSFTPVLNSGSFLVSLAGAAPLADFSATYFGHDFTSVKSCIVTAVLSNGTTERVIGIGLLATQTGFALNQINLVNSNGNMLATTGALQKDGESFTISWVASS